MTPFSSTPDPAGRLARNGSSDRHWLDLFVHSLALGLTLFIAGLFVWEYQQVEATAIRMARTDCLSSLNKDLVYRRWAAGHGGVYVPVTPETPPNPYLSHIPERDITTPSGKRLTLMNPAYMTRQVHELAREQYGTQGHITSLKPLRPENGPDPWEAKALAEFERGATEISSVEEMNGSRYVRMMRPMVTEAGCLKCHSHQGYKINEIRGGLSVSVPLAPYLKTAKEQSPPVFWGLGLSWVLGINGLWVAKGWMRRASQIRRQAAEKLSANEARYRNFFKNNYSVMLAIDPESGDIVDANPAAAAFYGWSEAELKGKKVTDINIATPEEIIAEMARAKEQSRNYFQFQHRLADGSTRDVEVYSGPLQMANKTLLFSIVHDISERRRAEDTVRRSLQEKVVLLKEIHHRVKNNMQVIYSLLNLQARGIADPAIRAMFEESRNRVNSMAMIHEKLYRSKDFASVDFKEYLQGLVASIAETYKRPEIIWQVEMAPLSLDVNVGIPCGLIVNELVSNSMKHAFPDGRGGMIRIGIERDGERMNVLTVQDDGVGFAAGIDFRNTTSLGLQLVTVLTGQLKGTIEMHREGGTSFCVTFPEEEEK